MLLLGDCLDALPHWPDNTFDLVCTDPPYGLAFMNKHWDHGVPGVEYWREVLRVAKPGAYLTAFGGTRTFHRLVCAIEDAGWEVRDCLMWLYGTGFPKSLNVGKALDKAAGAEREILGYGFASDPAKTNKNPRATMPGGLGQRTTVPTITAPATDLAKLYDGYGTALKPSYEPVILARKPLVGTVAQTVQQYGTGGINIDAVRVEWDPKSLAQDTARRQLPGDDIRGGHLHAASETDRRGYTKDPTSPPGRWPPNVLLGHASDCTEEACCQECPCAMLDELAPKTGSLGDVTRRTKKPSVFYQQATENPVKQSLDAPAGASRFFHRFHYSSKTSCKERAGSTHPTVKPLAVVEWLLRLTAPPGRPVVLDPFVGSGTTLIAAERLGIDSVGVEREPEYVEQAYRRVIRLRETAEPATVKTPHENAARR